MTQWPSHSCRRPVVAGNPAPAADSHNRPVVVAVNPNRPVVAAVNHNRPVVAADS